MRPSRGQVQRLTAVRMAVRQPELIVVDDASSALDMQKERTLWRRLRESPTGLRTILAVSHRRPVLRQADQIVALEDEQGRSSAVGHSPRC
jgi:ATP-binding cassette subfamily B protein